MRLTKESAAYLALSGVWAVSNVIMQPQIFAAGFAIGVLAGLGENIYRYLNRAQEDTCELKKKMNPCPGPLGAFVGFVAAKVNEYALLSYLPFYGISLLAGVPLGHSAGKFAVFYFLEKRSTEFLQQAVNPYI